MTKELQECWSADEENFNHNCLQDLLDSNDELKVGDVVYVGLAKHPEPGQICDADDIIDRMSDNAWDIGGEYAEDYPDVTKEAHQELDDFIKQWIMKHCPPNFYLVVNVREHVLTEEDLKR